MSKDNNDKDNTKFPSKYEDGMAVMMGYPDDGYCVYPADEVDEWIMKCIDDFPLGSWMKLANVPFGWENKSEFYFKTSIDKWFHKWFKQFKKKRKVVIMDD